MALHHVGMRAAEMSHDAQVLGEGEGGILRGPEYRTDMTGRRSSALRTSRRTWSLWAPRSRATSPG